MAEAKVVELNLPLEILATIRERKVGGESDEERIRVLLAVGLFADGAISLGKAAELAGIHRLDFALLLKRIGIPAYEYTREDFEQDKATIDELLQKLNR